jgi:hypothetical protein
VVAPCGSTNRVGIGKRAPLTLRRACQIIDSYASQGKRVGPLAGILVAALPPPCVPNLVEKACSKNFLLTGLSAILVSDRCASFVFSTFSDALPGESGVYFSFWPCCSWVSTFFCSSFSAFFSWFIC